MSSRFPVSRSARETIFNPVRSPGNSAGISAGGRTTASAAAFFSSEAAGPADPKNPLPGPRSTRLFRVLNPELFVKPNAAVALIGTVAFVGVLGSLYLEKQAVEKQRAEAKAAAEAALLASGRTLSSDDRV